MWKTAKMLFTYSHHWRLSMPLILNVYFISLTSPNSSESVFIHTGVNGSPGQWSGELTVSSASQIPPALIFRQFPPPSDFFLASGFSGLDTKTSLKNKYFWKTAFVKIQQTEPYAKNYSSFDHVLIWTENFQKQPFGRKQLGGRVEEKEQSPINSKPFGKIWLCFPPCFPCWSHWKLAAVWKITHAGSGVWSQNTCAPKCWPQPLKCKQCSTELQNVSFVYFLCPPPIGHQHISQWAQGLQIQAKALYITSVGRGSYSTSSSTPQGH